MISRMSTGINIHCPPLLGNSFASMTDVHASSYLSRERIMQTLSSIVEIMQYAMDLQADERNYVHYLIKFG